MKRNFLRFLAATLLLGVCSTAKAQLQLNAQTGWQFGGKMNIVGGDVRYIDSQDFQFGISYRIRDDYHIELSMTHMQSTLQINSIHPSYDRINDRFDLGTTYYFLGAVRELDVHDKLVPFGLVNLGAVYMSPKDRKYDDDLRFAFGFGGGLKFFLTPTIGIRAQARLLSPVYFAGTSLHCGTGGCGAGLSAGSTFLSGDISGGVVVKLGRD